MILRGQLAEMLVASFPEVYAKFVVINKNNESVLYVRLRKALYGIIQAALLFYKKLVKDLKQYGFQLNPYDPCVANMMVDGKQLTVLWHVDDMKISHADPSVITKMIQWLKSRYDTILAEGVGKMKATHGLSLIHI